MLDVDAIEVRANAATPPPWQAQYRDGADGRLWNVWAAQRRGENSEADSVFTAHAREDVPALIEEVRKLRAELERYPRYPLIVCEDGIELCTWCGTALGAEE